MGAKHKYQRVPSRLWEDPRFRAVSVDAKVAGLYVLTCRSRTTEGLFRLPAAWAAHDLGWDTARAGAAWAEMGWLFEVDPAVDLVLILDALELQPPVGPKQIAGAVNKLVDTPRSPLQFKFIELARVHCPALADQIIERLAWPEPQPDTPSIPHRNSIEALSHTPSIALTHPPSPGVSLSNTPEPVDNHGGDGGDGDASSSEPEPLDPTDPAVVDLADELARTAHGDPTATAKPIHRVHVAALLPHTGPDPLRVTAADVASRDSVNDPAAYLARALDNLRAERVPPPAPTAPAPTLDDPDLDTADLEAQLAAEARLLATGQRPVIDPATGRLTGATAR